MGPLKILLIILSSFVVAAVVFFAGSFIADYTFEHSARLHAREQANAAAVIVPMYFLARFIICPVVSIAAGAFTCWKIAKSRLAL
jgi:Kef-type K+ transport system membrane component KefB